MNIEDIKVGNYVRATCTDWPGTFKVIGINDRVGKVMIEYAGELCRESVSPDNLTPASPIEALAAKSREAVKAVENSNPTNSLITIGSIVKLKSNSPKMTVTDQISTDRFTCTWFVDNKVMQTGDFSIEALELVDDKMKEAANTQIINHENGSRSVKVTLEDGSVVETNAVIQPNTDPLHPMPKRKPRFKPSNSTVLK